MVVQAAYLQMPKGVVHPNHSLIDSPQHRAPAKLVVSASLIFLLPNTHLPKSCSASGMGLSYDVFLSYTSSHLFPPPVKFWKFWKKFWG